MSYAWPLYFIRDEPFSGRSCYLKFSCVGMLYDVFFAFVTCLTVTSLGPSAPPFYYSDGDCNCYGLSLRILSFSKYDVSNVDKLSSFCYLACETLSTMFSLFVLCLRLKSTDDCAFFIS